MKAVPKVVVLLLVGLVFAGCVSVPPGDEDERPWSQDSRGWRGDTDAAEENGSR